ncbi:MAG: YHYH protein [Saprospiraceae bacterium]|nr:YHYH protein [Saprospiraceae bacterium]
MKNLKVLIASLFAMGMIWTSCQDSEQTTPIEGSTTQAIDDFFLAYALVNADYGTETVVTIEDDTRVMVTNALPNHDTGSFPNAGNPNSISEQNIIYRIPLNPQLSGQSVWVREPGVALNGVKFEPETAEVLRCTSGENYKIEAIQDLVNLGLDHNHAHVQPTGAYHYHGAPTGVIAAFEKGEDLVHIGFAMDGFPIYYSQSNAYRPSYQLVDEDRKGTDCTYEIPGVSINTDMEGTEPDGTYVLDWEYVSGLGDLDECNGISINGEYRYLVTDGYPYIGRCLKGVL